MSSNQGSNSNILSTSYNNQSFETDDFFVSSDLKSESVMGRKSDTALSSKQEEIEKFEIKEDIVDMRNFSNELYVCKVCNEKFYDLAQLDAHRSKENHYCCNIEGCNLLFPNPTQALNHRLQIHDGKQTSGEIRTENTHTQLLKKRPSLQLKSRQINKELTKENTSDSSKLVLLDSQTQINNQEELNDKIKALNLKKMKTPTTDNIQSQNQGQVDIANLKPEFIDLVAAPKKQRPNTLVYENLKKEGVNKKRKRLPIKSNSVDNNELLNKQQNGIFKEINNDSNIPEVAEVNLKVKKPNSKRASKDNSNFKRPYSKFQVKNPSGLDNNTPVPKKPKTTFPVIKNIYSGVEEKEFENTVSEIDINNFLSSELTIGLVPRVNTASNEIDNLLPKNDVLQKKDMNFTPSITIQAVKKASNLINYNDVFKNNGVTIQPVFETTKKIETPKVLNNLKPIDNAFNSEITVTPSEKNRILQKNPNIENIGCNLCSAVYSGMQELITHKRLYHNEGITPIDNKGNIEMALPVVDLKSTYSLTQLINLGIENYVSLPQLNSISNGLYGIPIINVSGKMNLESNDLNVLGAVSVLALGPLKSLPKVN